MKNINNTKDALLAILVAVLIMCVFFGCNNTNRDVPIIKIILPQGYIGEFSIIVDEKFGEEIKPSNNTYVFSINKNGELRVRSYKVFHGWHQSVYEYPDGGSEKIDVSYVGDTHRSIPEVRKGSVAYVTQPGDGSQYKYSVILRRKN